MNVDSKKELLRYKLLDQRYEYDMEIYTLINSKKLDNQISKISEVSFSFHVETHDNQYTAKQFLNYMELFVKTMKSYFFHVYSIHNLMYEIIKSCDNELNDFLSIKTNQYDLRNIYENQLILEKLYKLIIGNFVKNAKYIPQIGTVLKDSGITIKQISDYDYNESKKILNILSDIVFCQRGRGKVLELFENIEYNLKDYLKSKKYGKTKYSIDYYREKFLKKRIANYESILKVYESKKKYLKFFI